MLDIDPFTASPRELLASVEDIEPGPFAMAILLMIDRSRLSGEDAITFLQVHERVTSWWASIQAEALVAAASPARMIDEFTILDADDGRAEERTIRIHDAVRDEVSAALRWSPSTTQGRIDTARLLHGPLVPTREALARGEISAGHVSVIVEAARRLPGLWSTDTDEVQEFADHCQAFQQRVLPIARRGTLSMTRQAANRCVLTIDAEGQRRRRDLARCTRDVWVVDEPDGLSTLMARMSTEHAHAVKAACDDAARMAGQSTGNGVAGPMAAVPTIGEARADALLRLVLGASDSPSSDPASSEPGVLRAHLEVIVPLDVLLGESDGPAELLGAGAVSAAVIHDLLAGPQVALMMRRLLIDPASGALVDVGRQTYTVPDRLRAFIVARDRTCRFPGCQRRAANCQIDHAVAWQDGGGTDAANLGALCVRHHQLKTHAGWKILDSDAAGGCSWLSPHGRRYRRAGPARGGADPPQIA
ncbi:MAG: DUF222 domain-containing protein [Actinobacteria bacterium]|nr:DUF222 domain-containing protein [Actinomycetota bacterium]